MPPSTDAHETSAETPPGEGGGAAPDAQPLHAPPQPSLDPPAPEAGAAPVPGERLGVPQGAARNPPDAVHGNPSYVFLLAVSLVSFALDIASKAWAASHLDGYPGMVEVIPHYVTLILAHNRGGAWGLLQTTSENIRRPFFLLVSVAAIGIIPALYRRVQPRQRALKWGLGFVLGGALGNVLDRVRFGHVIDFIDVHVTLRGVEHHWPTFNVADVAICVGVGLMSLDMFFTKRGPGPVPRAPEVPPAQSGEPVPGWGAPRVVASTHAEDAAPVQADAGPSESPR